MASYISFNRTRYENEFSILLNFSIYTQSTGFLHARDFMKIHENP